MDPRLPKKRVNHPSHLHVLNKTDVREAYDSYRARWQCDTCLRRFDGYGPEQHVGGDSEEPDPRHSYHCALCNYDICSQCYKGHLHSFHCHRLQIARPPLIYPRTNGQWRCDACKRVFSEETEQTCYHCQDCEVDLCTKCFKGDWHHVLHDHALHSLRPVDPRLEYRRHSEWYCDHCTRHYTEDDNQIFFHCDECQFDLCTECFHGKKHHLHKHRLISTQHNTRNPISCSNCRSHVMTLQYHICRDPLCGYTLCQACHMTSPKPHPYHAHPLELWDPLEVYPQSGGLWHCDRCTENHPTKQQTPIPPTSNMYHCEQCEFDLCEKCYISGLASQQPSSSHRNSLSGNNRALEGLHRPYYREGYTARQESQSPSLSSPPPHQPYAQEAGAERMPVRKCLACSVYPASLRLVHGGLPCTDVAICCRRCANDVVLYGKTCPLCGRVAEALLTEARS